MNKMKCFMFLLLLCFVNTSYSQQAGYYYRYDFEYFLASKTKDGKAWKKLFQESMRYPAICAENMIEGEAIFFLMYHGNGQF